MRNSRRNLIIGTLVLILFYTGPMGRSEAAIIHPEVGFLVIAPDRGFLGNEEVREVVKNFSQKYTASLAFATEEKTLENLKIGIDALKVKKIKKIWVLPLFISPGNTLYQHAVKALNEQKWAVPLKIGDTMKESYLTEELLKDRIKDLSKAPSKEVLMLVGYGAVDEKGEAEIKGDLEEILGRVNKGFRFRATEVAVLYDWSAEDDLRDAAFEQFVERAALNRAKADRVLVVPFHWGKKLTNMMAVSNWLRRSVSKYDKVVAGKKGILPHDNVGLWLRKEANLRLPLSDKEIGVVLMPHGSSFNWNETIRKNLKPLLERYKIEYAFSMADPKVIERAVERLEKRGARAIVVVRIFSLAASFREKTEYILGLNRHYRRGGRTMRINSSVLFTTLGGVERTPLAAAVMLERAKKLSNNPKKDTIILLGHGTDNEERNNHWMENLAALADQMRKNGGSDFRDIRFHTWREDWPDKRDESVKVIRSMIEEASLNGGTAIVVPERTAGQGHGDKYFKGLKYRYATGFSPHPNFMKWVEQQIGEGKARLQEKVKKAGYLQGERTEQALLETR